MLIATAHAVPSTGKTAPASDTLFSTTLKSSTNAVWKSKAIYRFKDEQVGQWYNIATIVMG